MNHSDLQQFRQQLETEKQQLQKRLDAYGPPTDRSERDQTGELSTADNHPADLASEMFERSKDLALIDHDELRLLRIEEALEAMDEERYGICLHCQQPIDIERLRAMPESLYCVEHTPKQHVSRQRPIEEAIMNESLNRQRYDERDGADTWHIVAQWGNSDSPAMSTNRDADDYEEISIGEEAPEYVESFESFLATDITGSHVSVVPNQAYYDYLDSDEGDHMLELEGDPDSGGR